MTIFQTPCPWKRWNKKITKNKLPGRFNCYLNIVCYFDLLVFCVTHPPHYFFIILFFSNFTPENNNNAKFVCVYLCLRYNNICFYFVIVTFWVAPEKVYRWSLAICWYADATIYLFTHFSSSFCVYFHYFQCHCLDSCRPFGRIWRKMNETGKFIYEQQHKKSIYKDEIWRSYEKSHGNWLKGMLLLTVNVHWSAGEIPFLIKFFFLNNNFF